MADNHVLTTPELRAAKPVRGDFAALRREPITLVLDNVAGLYNIGAIFRLCDAFLVSELIICGEAVPDLPRRRRVAQAAMGAQRWVPWRTAADAESVAREARAAGVWIGAAELTAASVPLSAMTPRFPAMLVVGAELSGVSTGVLDRADQVIAVPMRGMSNSLNVATATAIILHELANHIRRR